MPSVEKKREKIKKLHVYNTSTVKYEKFMKLSFLYGNNVFF
jgi:hypothetical protein